MSYRGAFAPKNWSNNFKILNETPDVGIIEERIENVI